jgi:hypothetical protein
MDDWTLRVILFYATALKGCVALEKGGQVGARTRARRLRREREGCHEITSCCSWWVPSASPRIVMLIVLAGAMSSCSVLSEALLGCPDLDLLLENGLWQEEHGNSARTSTAESVQSPAEQRSGKEEDTHRTLGSQASVCTKGDRLGFDVYMGDFGDDRSVDRHNIWGHADVSDSWDYVGSARGSHTFKVRARYTHVLITWVYRMPSFDAFENSRTGVTLGRDSHGHRASYDACANLTSLREVLGPPDGIAVLPNPDCSVGPGRFYIRLSGPLRGNEETPDLFTVWCSGSL